MCSHTPLAESTQPYLCGHHGRASSPLYKEHEPASVLCFGATTMSDKPSPTKADSAVPHALSGTTYLPSKCKATPLRCNASTLNGFSASNLPVTAKAASAPSWVPISSHAAAFATARETIPSAAETVVCPPPFPTNPAFAERVPSSVREPALGSSSSPCVGSTTTRRVGGGRGWSS